MTSRRELSVVSQVSLCAEEARRNRRFTNNKLRIFRVDSPAVRRRARLRGVMSQEPAMSNRRSNFLFFGLIAASLCAAVVLIGLLVAGDVAGPRMAMNH